MPCTERTLKAFRLKCNRFSKFLPVLIHSYTNEGLKSLKSEQKL